MMRFLGAFGVFLFVGAAGSEFAPNANSINVFWMLGSAAIIGFVIGSIADGMRA